MFIIKTHNLVLAVLICFTLTGCGTVKNPVTTDEIETQRINTWLNDVRHIVNENINRQGIDTGHHLRLLVVVNDMGYSVSISIVESTGNRKLETESIAAIKKFEPFQFPNVNEKYREQLKKMVFYVTVG